MGGWMDGGREELICRRCLRPLNFVWRSFVDRLEVRSNRGRPCVKYTTHGVRIQSGGFHGYVGQQHDRTLQTEQSGLCLARCWLGLILRKTICLYVFNRVLMRPVFRRVCLMFLIPRSLLFSPRHIKLNASKQGCQSVCCD